MIEEQKMISIELSTLIENVTKMRSDGYRLVQVSCTRCADCLEINYSFDRDYQFVNLRITVSLQGAVVPSISGIYWAGFLYENEMHDLFGVEVSGMALDYKGTFYKTTVKWPFNLAPEKKEGVSS
jgi:ech hydrogenase subunit D